MMVPNNALGMYGKLPILGDFVSRRLSGDFIRPWDEWLQDAISASRRHLGTAWLDVYLTSPVWRFILRPGICGTGAWAGVLIPSVDKVGRYFPLTLAAPIPERRAVPRLFIRMGEWFDRVEALALSALRDDFDMAEFEAQPNSPTEGGHTETDDTPQAGQSACCIQMETPADMPEALIDLSSCLISKLMPGCSLWTSAGSEHVRPCLRIYESLPPASAYSGFLTDRENQREGEPF